MERPISRSSILLILIICLFNVVNGYSQSTIPVTFVVEPKDLSIYYVSIYMGGALVKSFNITGSGQFTVWLYPGSYEVLVVSPGYLRGSVRIQVCKSCQQKYSIRLEKTIEVFVRYDQVYLYNSVGIAEFVLYNKDDKHLLVEVNVSCTGGDFAVFSSERMLPSSFNLLTVPGENLVRVEVVPISRNVRCLLYYSTGNLRGHAEAFFSVKERIHIISWSRENESLMVFNPYRIPLIAKIRVVGGVLERYGEEASVYLEGKKGDVFKLVPLEKFVKVIAEVGNLTETLEIAPKIFALGIDMPIQGVILKDSKTSIEVPIFIKNNGLAKTILNVTCSSPVGISCVPLYMGVPIYSFKIRPGEKITLFLNISGWGDGRILLNISGHEYFLSVKQARKPRIVFLNTNYRVNIVPGGSAVFDLYVKNVGNAAVREIKPSLSLPQGLVAEVKPEKTEILPGETKVFRILFKAYPNLSPGDYIVKVTVGYETVDIRLVVEQGGFNVYIALGISFLSILALFLLYRKYGRR